MKKFIILSILAVFLPVTMMAQDDVYFTPKKVEKKADKAAQTKSEVQPAVVTHSGSSRDVDEYNRRGLQSYYQKIGTDSLGNDIIEFHVGEGYSSANDTIYAGPVQYDFDDADSDYEYTRRMSRWDGFYDPWFYSMGYGWHSPWWYHRYGWYDPWFYDSFWYDPWYYGGYYGWYSPWYYGGWGGYYGWHSPWYYGGWYGGWGGYWWPHNYAVAYNGPTGSQGHGRINYNVHRGIRNGSSVTFDHGTFGGRSVGTFGGSRSTSASASRSTGSKNRTTRNANGNFGGSRSRSYDNGSSSRSNTRSYTPSSSSSSGSFGGGSFGGSTYGGSRSSGGSFGGGHSSGGGSRGGFGGRRN